MMSIDRNLKVASDNLILINRILFSKSNKAYPSQKLISIADISNISGDVSACSISDSLFDILVYDTYPSDWWLQNRLATFLFKTLIIIG